MGQYHAGRQPGISRREQGLLQSGIFPKFSARAPQHRLNYTERVLDRFIGYRNQTGPCKRPSSLSFCCARFTWFLWKEEQFASIGFSLPSTLRYAYAALELQRFEEYSKSDEIRQIPPARYPRKRPMGVQPKAFTIDIITISGTLSLNTDSLS